MATTAKEARREWELKKAIEEQQAPAVESLFMKHSQAAYSASEANIKRSAQNLIGNLTIAIKEQEYIKSLANGLTMPAYETLYKNRITNYQKILKILTDAIRDTQTIMEDQ